LRLWLLRQALPKRRASPPLAALRAKTGKLVSSKQLGMAEIDSEAAVSSERYREYASVFISLHKSSERAILVRLHHFCQYTFDRACDVFRQSKGKLAVYLQPA
jgi:hypothetical protein